MPKTNKKRTYIKFLNQKTQKVIFTSDKNNNEYSLSVKEEKMKKELFYELYDKKNAQECNIKRSSQVKHKHLIDILKNRKKGEVVVMIIIAILYLLIKKDSILIDPILHLFLTLLQKI